MNFVSCRHIMTSGQQCRSPRLRDADYCYFHKRLHARHQAMLKARIERPLINTEGEIIGYGRPVGFQSARLPDLGPLEDRASVQMAISTVVNALATEALDIKRATALLYGLQLASANCPKSGDDFYNAAHDPIDETEQTEDGTLLAPSNRVPAPVVKEEEGHTAEEQQEELTREMLRKITRTLREQLSESREATDENLQLLAER